MITDWHGGPAYPAESTVASATPELHAAALGTLKALARACPIPVSFDLAELRGYHYHSGVVFDAYCEGVVGPVARGGRYDEVGKAFGRPRPATCSPARKPDRKGSSRSTLPCVSSTIRTTR